MKVVFSTHHRTHNPKSFIVRGRIASNPETPDRVDILLASARSVNYQTIEASPHQAEVLIQVHTPRYLDFLQNGFISWQKLRKLG